jgi:hypothetical protein
MASNKLILIDITFYAAVLDHCAAATQDVDLG